MCQEEIRHSLIDAPRIDVRRFLGIVWVTVKE